MPLQVIGAGCSRTGTYSLHLALEILGYKTHHGFSAVTDSSQDPAVWSNALANGNNTREEWEKVYGAYDAAMDWPTCAFYKQLFQQYPESKVILTARSAESWYASVSQTILPLLRWSFLGFLVPNHLWKIYQVWRRTFVNGAVTDPYDDSPLFDRDTLIRCYNAHVDEVKTEIPADRLLVFGLHDGWEPLCSFLGKPIPNVPFPSANTRGGFAVFFWEPLRQVWGDQLWFKIWENMKLAVDKRPRAIKLITPTRAAAAVYIVSKVLVRRFDLGSLMNTYIHIISNQRIL